MVFSGLFSSSRSTSQDLDDGEDAEVGEYGFSQVVASVDEKAVEGLWDGWMGVGGGALVGGKEGVLGERGSEEVSSQDSGGGDTVVCGFWGGFEEMERVERGDVRSGAEVSMWEQCGQ